MSGEIYAYFYNVQSQTFQESSVQEVLQLWVLPEAARLMVLKVSHFKPCWDFWGISRTLSSLQVSHFFVIFQQKCFRKTTKNRENFRFPQTSAIKTRIESPRKNTKTQVMIISQSWNSNSTFAAMQRKVSLIAHHQMKRASFSYSINKRIWNDRSKLAQQKVFWLLTICLHLMTFLGYETWLI